MLQKLAGLYQTVESKIPTEAIAVSAKSAGKGMALAAGYAVPSIIVCGILGAVSGAINHYVTPKETPAPAPEANFGPGYYREAA